MSTNGVNAVLVDHAASELRITEFLDRSQRDQLAGLLRILHRALVEPSAESMTERSLSPVLESLRD